MRNVLTLLIILCVSALLPEISSAGDKPNIVLIVADDLGYGETGAQGNKEIPTPHIDSLARDGVRFTSGYVTAPVCAPSRAGFLSGRHQRRFGWNVGSTIPITGGLFPRTGDAAWEFEVVGVYKSKSDNVSCGDKPGKPQPWRPWKKNLPTNQL